MIVGRYDLATTDIASIDAGERGGRSWRVSRVERWRIYVLHDTGVLVLGHSGLASQVLAGESLSVTGLIALLVGDRLPDCVH